ncbi:hypothetical protein A2W14_04525 [Candidatus Gottesmanbacteria bacterium RBG_16_37_8]|uniref:Uncharacterized protein n=1 Tax=Candidatus Gottesmanbacteria bacterium RBG_16_37_8 TaxID=1798371 RepID=A0A1F5YT09_9BACT|nr:MAG: hypothetical protein A2W14_04525 [Candidatus Gottesmanbacteria bacterium RBG_16_37_8]
MTKSNIYKGLLPAGIVMVFAFLILGGVKLAQASSCLNYTFDYWPTQNPYTFHARLNKVWCKVVLKRGSERYTFTTSGNHYISCNVAGGIIIKNGILISGINTEHLYFSWSPGCLNLPRAWLDQKDI